MNHDYLLVLQALQEIPFGVGKKLLTEFLQGKSTNDSILRNKLDRLEFYGTMIYTDNEIKQMIDSLLMNNMISLVTVKGNKFWKVMQLTQKGINEIENPSLRSINIKYKTTDITDAERLAFNSLPFLEPYNEFQKKAIISQNKSILCVAGAGSGKTTVLTKRIEFLIKYRSADPKRILAITFTKKARFEMMSRLANSEVQIETFNSFGEKILRTHNDLIYDRPVNMLSYRDKIIIITKALTSLGISKKQAIDTYFSSSQRRNKTDEKLSNIFLNDIFFLRDYFKSKQMPLIESSFDVPPESHKSFRLVLSICQYVEGYLKKHGLRDFSDQLLDTVTLFKTFPKIVPSYDHVLIDEFQDINKSQIELINLIKPSNIFCVGDPRQSIYGWRGSDISYIINFPEMYPSPDIINLVVNYRSTKPIVNLINSSIKSMNLPDLESNIIGDNQTKLVKFRNTVDEYNFVISTILSSEIQRTEIFILSRTNKMLNDISAELKKKKIPHVLRSENARPTAEEGQITLATIHSIKGLEAEMVFVIGCTPHNFPCRASEHPVIDMVKAETYDKQEEERRLIYVALSRSKSILYLTYTGKSHTYFITDQMLTQINTSKPKDSSNHVYNRLKEWRGTLSQKNNIPAYLILHDKTLLDISIILPQSLIELDEIHGMGPTKTMKYGNQILDLVRG